MTDKELKQRLRENGVSLMTHEEVRFVMEEHGVELAPVKAEEKTSASVNVRASLSAVEALCRDVRIIKNILVYGFVAVSLGVVAAIYHTYR